MFLKIIDWLKKIFVKETVAQVSLNVIDNSILELSETLAATEGNIQKRLRRLALAQQQQSDAVSELVVESKALKDALQQRHGLVLNYTRILEHLDNLNKIERVLSSTDNDAMANGQLLAPLLYTTTVNFLLHCELQPIAELGEFYPESHCEVLGAVESRVERPGVVHEILQQGYISINGSTIRGAKVMVYKEPSEIEMNSAESIEDES
jgi:molecular chaperone GrpE (heat shock protein)